MNYKDFFISELFPDVDIELTDEYLKQHGWSKILPIGEKKSKSYYFDGPIGRIYVERYGKKPHFSLNIQYRYDDTRHVDTITDIKVAIYSYVRGLRAVKYGSDGIGYKWIDIDIKEEKEEYRYNKYIEMTKWMKND